RNASADIHPVTGLPRIAATGEFLSRRKSQQPFAGSAEGFQRSSRIAVRPTLEVSEARLLQGQWTRPELLGPPPEIRGDRTCQKNEKKQERSASRPPRHRSLREIASRGDQCPVRIAGAQIARKGPNIRHVANCACVAFDDVPTRV